MMDNEKKKKLLLIFSFNIYRQAKFGTFSGIISPFQANVPFL